MSNCGTETAETRPDPHLEFTRQLVAAQSAFHGFLFSLVHDRHATDDLLQELACRLWLKFPEYDRTKPFVAWGIGYARLLAFEWRRKQARLPLPMDDETLNALAETAAESAVRNESQSEALRGCLRSLTDHQRHALVLHYQEDRSVGDIARLWNRTTMAVYKVLKRSHEALLDCMRKTIAEQQP